MSRNVRTRPCPGDVWQYGRETRILFEQDSDGTWTYLEGGDPDTMTPVAFRMMLDRATYKGWSPAHVVSFHEARRRQREREQLAAEEWVQTARTWDERIAAEAHAETLGTDGSIARRITEAADLLGMVQHADGLWRLDGILGQRSEGIDDGDLLERAEVRWAEMERKAEAEADRLARVVEAKRKAKERRDLEAANEDKQTGLFAG